MVESNSGLTGGAPVRAGDEFLRFQFTVREPIDLGAAVGAQPGSRAREREVRNVVIVLAVLTAWRDPFRWIAYSRDRNVYAGVRRYLGALASYGATIWAIESMASADLIYHRRSRPGPNGRYRSTFRATEKLVQSAPIGHVDQLQPIASEPIRLKDKAKRLSGYKDSRKTRFWREDVCAQNLALQHARLELQSPDWVVDAHGLFRFRDRTINPLHDQLYRVFNGDWGHGGRFYGGWWQDLAKRHREQIRIDGRPVIERDFPHLHPTLLAAITGADLGAEDPYRIDGFDRTDVKRAVNILINADNDGAALLALRQRFIGTGKNKPHSRAAHMIASVRERHPQFARHWGTGIGRRLQFIDSEMCAEIQRTMRETGSPVLSVHDSFIALQPDKARLQEVMDDVLDRTKRSLAAR